MCGEPDFCLRLAFGPRAAVDRGVDSVRVLTGTAWSADRLGDLRDVLVVIGVPGERLGRQPVSSAIEGLLREMSRQRAAGLAVAVERQGARSVPAVIRSSAARLNVPLLTTTKSLGAWKELAPRLREYRYQHAEWHAEQLTALLNRLPSRLADADGDAMQRVTDWLAAALDGEVLVSDPLRGVLAASPESAPGTLAPLLAGHLVRAELPASVPSVMPLPSATSATSATSGPAGTVSRFPAPSVPPAPTSTLSTPSLPSTAESASIPDTTPHTRFQTLAAMGSPSMLSVASRRPFDDTGVDLLRHAGKVLSLIDQIDRRHSQVAEAEHAVRLGAFQFLMVGEEIAAQRAMAALTPWLLATEKVRVYVIDCGEADREIAARRSDRAIADRAMLVRCPAFNHLIVVDPVRDQDNDPAGVRDSMRQVVVSLPEHRMGGSRAYALSEVADAYAEAADALSVARQLPDRVALSNERADLLSALPPVAARRWAATVLRPLLALPMGQRDQLLRTLDLGLELHHASAARLVGIHRNTVTQRISRAFGLLGLDRSRVLSQVVVSTAVKVVIAHGHDEPSPDATADFVTMLAVPEVHAWAESFLEPVRSDRRDLIRTLAAWLENDTHTQRTATALGLSPVTVRSHLRACAPLIGRGPAVGPNSHGGPNSHVGPDPQVGRTPHAGPRGDEQPPGKDGPDGGGHAWGGVRPLAFALYVTTGRPPLPAAWRPHS
ncbi:hypothetical protein ACWCXE_04410 [Streptomyces sp. NPDC001780]